MTDKSDLFDRLANELGFETVAETGRHSRFRYPELVRIHDRLNDLGLIEVPRDNGMNRTDLRKAIASAVGKDDTFGRPVTKPVVSELVGVLCVEGVAADGGSLAAKTLSTDEARPRPTAGDLNRAEAFELVYPWDTVGECVCVSRKQNSTRYHSRWLVEDDGTLRPACTGHYPDPDQEHRLVEEVAISRTKDKCDYCRSEEAKL